MIETILSPEQCAACKGCCVFDESDSWEIAGAAELIAANGGLVCGHLGGSGCTLGERKPPQCRLYPFRVMRVNGHDAIAVCSYCCELTKLPLERLLEFVRRNKTEILAFARENKIVGEYKDGYIILEVCHE